MRSGSYSSAMHSFQIETLTLIEESEIDELDNLIDIDLYQGKILNARDKITQISRNYVGDDKNAVVCLACTELPLAFQEQENSASFVDNGITYINTTVAHVNSVLDVAIR